MVDFGLAFSYPLPAPERGLRGKARSEGRHTSSNAAAPLTSGSRYQVYLMAGIEETVKAPHRQRNEG